VQGAGKPKNDRAVRCRGSVIHSRTIRLQPWKYRRQQLPVVNFCPTHGAFEQEANPTYQRTRLPGMWAGESLLAPPKTSSPRQREVWGEQSTTTRRLTTCPNNEKVNHHLRDQRGFHATTALNHI